MKRSVLFLLMLICAMALLCVPALAADGGIGALTTEANVTAEPQLADGTAVTADGDGVYAGAERVGLTWQGAAETGEQYMIWVLEGETATPTQDNIVYVDQKAASGADIGFELFPQRIESHKTYTVYVSSSASSVDGLKKLASFAGAGHTYGEPTWKWSDDHASATATFACTECGVKQDVTAVVTSETTPAGCTTEGKTVFTAKAEFEGSSYTDSQTVTIPKTGHDWKDWEITTPATCTADGEETRVCKNDASHKETRAVAKRGHDWGDWAVTTPATCTADGEETRVCKNDASHKETRAVAKLGHEWGDWVVTTPATETTEGVETRTCARCGEKEDRAIPVTGHTHTPTKVDAVPATCTADGTETYYKCSGCGRLFADAAGTTEISAPKTVPALGHNWGAWTATTPATCTAAGEETRTCARCGEKETRPTAALDHDWGAWTVTTPATCTAAGEETRFCARCGEKETRSTEKADHLWGAWTVTTEATCAAPGEETRTCARCGEKETRPIAALSHSWGAWEVTVPATETVKGQRTRTCTLCGAADTGEIPVLGHHHSMTPVDEVPATCTEDGHKAYYLCSDCGWMFEDAEGTKELSEADIRIPAEHDYIDEVVLPTCLEGGYTLHTCSRCGDSYVDEPVPAAGHKLTHVEAKAATETDDGNIEYWRCEECGRLFADDACATELPPAAVVIPATGGGAKPGDVNGDGHVSPLDAVIVLRHLIGAPKLEGAALARADANGDGQVTAADAAWILAHLG